MNNSSSQNIKETWALGDYKRLGSVISPVSAHLVRAVQVKEGDQVLDVACGYGNTAITARQKDAKVTGIDITPELLTLAIEEESIAKVSGITWKKGNVERLPFEDETFNVVLSTFGHMFALNQNQASKEMIRVLKKGGRIGFATWPSELVIGKLFSLIAEYMSTNIKTTPSDNVSHPPVPPSPMLWGEPQKIQEFLSEINDLHFERGAINYPILSPNHYWHDMITKSGPMIQVIRLLESQNQANEKIESLRKEYLHTIKPYICDNALRMDYLLTTGRKKEERRKL